MADLKFTTNAPDLTGQRFERLLVQAFAYKKNSGNFWTCLCDCGNETIVRGAYLLKHTTRSCGCLQQEMRAKWRKTHGMTGTRAHIRWKHMLSRCYNPQSKEYANYGGRGITVCERWRESFQAFYEDMGEPPPGLQLERKDNNQGYSPDNCCWATVKQQQRNRRVTIFCTFNNETRSLPEWSEITGLPLNLLYDRLAWDWSIERTLTTPVRLARQDFPEGMLLTWNGITQSIRHWAPTVGLNAGTLIDRLRKGWTVEQVLTAPPQTWKTKGR